MSIQPFTQQGNTITFTADAAAPTPVQAVGAGNNAPTAYVLSNEGTVTVFVGYGADVPQGPNQNYQSGKALATARAVIPTGTSIFCYPLKAGFQVTITAPSGCWFTGISSAPAVVYVTPGDGT